MKTTLFKILLSSIGVLVFTLGLVGCSQTTTTPSATSTASISSTGSTPSTTTSTSTTTSSTAASSVPPASTSAATTSTATKRTVVDAAGRTVTLPNVVNRVAHQTPYQVQTIFMLGAGDKLVATSYYTTKQNLSFLFKMYPQLEKVPAPFLSDGTVNLEALILSKPDVCFFSSLPKDEIVQSIEKNGIPVFVTGMGTDPATLKSGIMFTAKAMGSKEVQIAEAYSTYIDNNISKISAVTALIPKEQRLKLFYSADKPLSTEGGGGLVQWWAETSGARYFGVEAGLTGSGFKEINAEDIVKWNPDIIVVRDAPFKDLVLKDSRLCDVNAVKNNRVYSNPRGVYGWCVRSAEEALQILWAAKTMYPDKFPDLDVRQETKDFYQQFHGYTLSEDEVTEMLQPTQK